jgi:serine/threonine protein kinase
MDLILGTPLYMAPELCREDADEYDLKVDVWSIGCITHLLLAGELPFDSDSVAEIKSSIVNDELKLEKLLAKKVSKEAIEFI